MFCNIEYTTDNEQNWYPITNIEGPTPQDPNAYFSSNFSNWNPSPNDNPDGIKIRVTSTDTGIQGFRYCWVNELKLTADSLTPTTATPTTATPTTFTPTTTIPTTTAPTTATPTSNPTTSQPTTPTTNPTTSHPTSPTTPTMPPTTPKETSRTQEEGESNSGSTSGNTGEILVYVAIVFGVLLLIVCVGCIVYKNKSKKHQESNATVENEIAAQYMDAYASGGKVSTPVPPPNTGNINANNDGNTEYENRNQYGGNINANDGNRNQYGGYDGQYAYNQNQNQNENENQMKTEQQVVTNDANSGPAPPVELTQIFGPTQNERVSANRKDSDEDSIMKKQSYFNEHESND